MLKKIHIILSLLLFAVSVSAQDPAMSVVERNAAQGFNDTIDRLAPDFVTVGLIISEPGEILYSVLGHACLHLQCPTFNLDYIFSYESESVKGKVLRFLMNNLNMGMMGMSMEEYLQPYIEEGRGVKEYRLNLPAAVKTELWRMCDERMEQGMNLEYDPVKRGCAISVVHSVEDAIASANHMVGAQYRINYPSWGEKGKRTIREIFYENAAKGWGLFWCMTMVSGRYVDNPHIPTREKLIAPEELVARWQAATIDHSPIISQEPIELAPSLTQYTGERFSPLLCALLVLIISILCWVFKTRYLDYVLLGIYSVFSLLITYMLVFPSMPNTDWNWLIIPFNILPVLFWYWRRYWSLPYACIILLWCAVMTGEWFFGHILVDWPHIIFALAFAVVLLKQCCYESRDPRH